jgi:uncharacterized protein YfiM (DUF2279 family)
MIAVARGAQHTGDHMKSKQSFMLVCTFMLVWSSLCSAQMDKAMHTSAGFGITITVTTATNKPKLGLIAGIGAGIAKEAWDSTQRGHQASMRDFAATAAGSGAAFALWKLVLNRKPPVKIAKSSEPGVKPGTPAADSAAADPHTRPSHDGATASAIVPGGGN